MRTSPLGPALILAAALSLPTPAAEAQLRPFAYTVTTSSTRFADGAGDPRRWTAYYDTGYADRTSDPFGYDGVEQRLGVQGRLGGGFTVIGRVGLGLGAEATRTTQEAELLKDLLGASSPLRLAVGAGARREWSGTATALGRVSLGWSSGRTLVCGNVRFEKPLARDRDALDIISSVGWMQRVTRGLRIGVEAVGEDLEGFWDPNEAEGGAKFYAGPALHWTAPQGRLWASAGGGPIVYATRSSRSSSAPRELQAAGNGYTVRVSVGYTF